MARRLCGFSGDGSQFTRMIGAKSWPGQRRSASEDFGARITLCNIVKLCNASSSPAHYYIFYKHQNRPAGPSFRPKLDQQLNSFLGLISCRGPLFLGEGMTPPVGRWFAAKSRTIRIVPACTSAFRLGGCPKSSVDRCEFRRLVSCVCRSALQVVICNLLYS